MRDLLITDKAFALPPVVEIDPTEFSAFLKKVHEGENGFKKSLRNLTGRTTPNYNHRKSDYNRQLSYLFKQWMGLYSSSADLQYVSATITLLKSKLSGNTIFEGSAEERKHAYAGTKLYLEKIWYLTRDYPLTERRAYIRRLSEKIRLACGGGLFTLLADTLYALQSQDTHPFWIANFRSDHLQFLGEIRVAKESITNDSSMHTQIAFMKVAEKKKWGIPVAQNLKGFKDKYEVALKPEVEGALRLDFEKHITRQKILERVSDKYYGLFRHYKTMNLSLPDNLTAFQKLTALFEEHKIFDLDILEMNKAGETHIKEEFWAELPQYCETLLEKEGYILSREAIAQLQKTKQQEIEQLLAKQSKELVKEALPTAEKLLEALNFIKPETAHQLLSMIDRLQEYFLDDIYNLTCAFYHLPKPISKILAEHLNLDGAPTEGLSNFFLDWKLKTLLTSSKKKALIEDRHVLTYFFEGRSKIGSSYLQEEKEESEEEKSQDRTPKMYQSPFSFL